MLLVRASDKNNRDKSGQYLHANQAAGSSKIPFSSTLYLLTFRALVPLFVEQPREKTEGSWELRGIRQQQGQTVPLVVSLFYIP